jgi:protein-tyrosine phosphatase
MTSPSALDVEAPLTDRAIAFQSIVNFRDVGGLPVLGGGFVRRGLLYRSATLHMATPDDAAQLSRLGVCNVVDLRTDDERLRWPAQGAWSPEHVLHAPLLRKTWDSSSLEAAADPARFLAARYLDMINESGDVIASAVEHAAESATPTVIHCAAGKDRTGVLVAIIQGLLGVDHDLIADDYHLSAAAMADLQLLFGGGDPAGVPSMVDMPVAFLLAPREAMSVLLQTVRLDWRSMRGYARSIGVSPGVLDALQTRLVIR